MSRKYRQLSIETEVGPTATGTHEGFTCYHCGLNQRLRPMKVIGNVLTDQNEAIAARCTCCDKLICLACVGKGCTPLQRQLERMERQKDYAPSRS